MQTAMSRERRKGRSGFVGNRKEKKNSSLSLVERKSNDTENSYYSNSRKEFQTNRNACTDCMHVQQPYRDRERKKSDQCKEPYGCDGAGPAAG